MRLVAAFALSFAVTAVIWTLIFPAPPPTKPRPLARHAVVETTQAVTNPFDFLPAPPSSITPFTSPSQDYDVARQLMVKGRLREARDRYLRILLARTSIDQKAMQGLARVQGLLTNGDPVTLQRQADAYRQAIAQGSSAGEGHTPRELELLAEASLLAVQEIQAEPAPGRTPIGSRVPVVSGLRESSLPAAGTASHLPAPLAPSALGQQVLRLGQVVNPASAGPFPPSGQSGQPSSSDQSITIPIPALNTPLSGSSSGASSSGEPQSSAGEGSNGSWGGTVKGSAGSGQPKSSASEGSNGSWGDTVKGGAGSGRTGSTRSWGSTSDEGSDTEKQTNK